MDSTAVSPGSAAQATSVAQAWALLRSAQVGRLAIQVDDWPDIFPVNYVVDGGSVVFRTGSGTKFAAARGRRAAFEADSVDLVTGTAWSVVAKGTVQEVHDVDEVIDLLGLDLHPLHPAQKPHLMRMVAESVTGRVFTGAGETTTPRPPSALTDLSQ